MCMSIRQFATIVGLKRDQCGRRSLPSWSCDAERMVIMSDSILERIQRETGIPELIDVLVERLSPTDLKSLLLEVYRRRSLAVKPSHLLERYERDLFVRPSDIAPGVTT